ncbi:MAG: hypothetical protein P4N24_07370 [Acidobacteriota bacterium]|nr:hypothetical protein [Acidobacteriota bacterium]
MPQDRPPLALAIENYLASRPWAARWLERAAGRRYRLAVFPDRQEPVVVIAHRGRNPARMEQVARAVEQDWAETPRHCHDAYEDILAHAPGLIVVQLRRKNVCGCLGHRHVIVKEIPFSEPHDAFGDAAVGEMDIAFDRVESWLAQPLMDTALDTQFIAGSRRKEFHEQQLRFRLLSILLHETHHMVAPEATEDVVRGRSLTFYRDALANYVEIARASLSLTIDRSFSRLGKE